MLLGHTESQRTSSGYFQKRYKDQQIIVHQVYGIRKYGYLFFLKKIIDTKELILCFQTKQQLLSSDPC